MPTITGPTFGVTGLPENQVRKMMRADFQASKFEEIIETKGYRLVWSRACVCPCTPVNDQTQQPDPNCVLCKGAAWIYFGPSNYVLDTANIGALDDVQKALADTSKSAIIRGIMEGISAKRDLPSEKLGPWKFGDTSLTVRPENRLGFYDRITNLDSEIIYSEVITAGDPAVPLAARYLITGVNLLRSFSTVYTSADYELAAGKIVWKTGRAPAQGTRLAIHYLMHPTWLVCEHPKATRDTYEDIKKKAGATSTPFGDLKRLPVKAVLRYEFLL